MGFAVMTEHWTQKIEDLVKGIPLNQLAKERELLTHFYRHRKSSDLPALSSHRQRLAYLSARMPSTHAVICKVLMELKKRVPSLSISSVLDVGSGPGTVLFALDDLGLDVAEATLLERDPEFISLAKQLSSDLSSMEKKWICKDVLHVDSFPRHDVVVASYCLNELEEGARLKVVERLWDAASQFLIVIEPGTATDFRVSKQIREKLISLGGCLVAPCPHQEACPMQEPDWCHFSARLERSSLQRKVKGASLNYEDEKFFYLIFSKQAQGHCGSRLLKRPVRGKGFINIQLCSTQGIEEITLTQKNKELYSKLKKLEWGDGID